MAEVIVYWSVAYNVNYPWVCFESGGHLSYLVGLTQRDVVDDLPHIVDSDVLPAIANV